MKRPGYGEAASKVRCNSSLIRGEAVGSIQRISTPTPSALDELIDEISWPSQKTLL